MDLIELYPMLRSLWVVWFMAVFIGIVAWVFWPSRKAEFDRHARIPLNDDR
jgi:cytochrome c oxidase cbb3-type subunit IV